MIWGNHSCCNEEIVCHCWNKMKTTSHIPGVWLQSEEQVGKNPGGIDEYISAAQLIAWNRSSISHICQPQGHAYSLLPRPEPAIPSERARGRWVWLLSQCTSALSVSLISLQAGLWDSLLTDLNLGPQRHVHGTQYIIATHLFYGALTCNVLHFVVMSYNF